MKLKEAARRYKDCEVDEAKLEKILKLIPEEKKTIWNMKKDDGYCYIDTNNMIESKLWTDSGFDLNNVYRGNIYFSYEEAEFDYWRHFYELCLLKYGTRDMMSLGNITVKKFFIRYNHKEDSLYISSTRFIDNGNIYFASKELAQQAIDFLGEYYLKKYIFNVKVEKPK